MRPDLASVSVRAEVSRTEAGVIHTMTFKMVARCVALGPSWKKNAKANTRIVNPSHETHSKELCLLLPGWI